MRIFVPSVSFLSSVFLYVIEIKQVKLLLLSFFFTDTLGEEKKNYDQSTTSFSHNFCTFFLFLFLDFLLFLLTLYLFFS